MLYQTYQIEGRSRRAAALGRPLGPGRHRRPSPRPTLRHAGAALEMISRFELTHASPGFDIATRARSATATCR